MDENLDVNGNPIVSEDGEGEVVTPPKTVLPGEKTDPALLLKSLQEERDEKKKLKLELETKERELQALRDSSGNASEFSEEGQILNTKIEILTDELAVKDLTIQYPVLKDKVTEFNEFRKAYPGVSLNDVAELYLSKNGLIDAPKPPKGLEPAGGGTHTPAPQGYTAEEMDNIRTTDYRRFKELLQSGAFKHLV